MKITIAHPNGANLVYQELSKSYSAIELPIWAHLINSHLISRDHDSVVVDCEASHFTAVESARACLTKNPQLVVIVVFGQQPSAGTQNMHGASSLCDEIKKIDASVPVLLVGLYPSALSRKCLEETSTDYVCQGEGPATIDSLIDHIEGKVSIDKVPGLWYRHRLMGVKSNIPAPVTPQKDMCRELPGIIWDTVDLKRYRTSNWHSFTNLCEKTPFASIYTSLGCPFACSFCCINAPFGANNVEQSYGTAALRYWDLNFAADQIQTAYEKGARNLKIADEMFVLVREHFMNLCEEIERRGMGEDLNIWAYSRIDTVKPKYLKTLKKAGVNWLALGIESGDVVVRKDAVKGKFTDVNVSDVVKAIQDEGINVIGNFIFGLPEDTHETMSKTLEMAKHLDCDFVNFYSAMAYPGSKLYLESVRNELELPKTYSGYSQHSFDCHPMATKYVSAAEVLSFRDEAFHDFYEDPAYLLRTERKFGVEAKRDIEEMTKIKLKRELLTNA